MDIDIEIFDIEERHLEIKHLHIGDDSMKAATHQNHPEHPAKMHLPMINETYEIIWTKDVVFRVTTIVILMILTLIGNLSMVFMILCHRKLRKRRVNVFLVNLAIGDIMVCVVTMTSEIMFVAFGEWILGDIGCKLTVYGQIVTLASTTFLLTAMSIDRYQVIVRPLQSLRGQPKVWHKVLAAWIMAFVFAMPQLFIFVQTDEGIHQDGHIKHLCRSQGYQKGQKWQRKAYFSFLAAYILVIPTVIMIFCYINIIRVVFKRAGDNVGKPKLRFTSSRRSSSVLLQKQSVDSQSELECALNSKGSCSGTSLRKRHVTTNMAKFSIPKNVISSSKRNVVKMTFSVIIAFILCWSPYFIIGLIRIFSEYAIRLDLLYSIAEIMAMLHSALNPILYGAFSTNSAIKSVKATSCFEKRKSEKIVVNISVGSDFDSLVFVTHPELYTRRLSISDNKVSTNCRCAWLAGKLCFCFQQKEDNFSKNNTPSQLDVKSRRQLLRHPNKATCSVKSEQSHDSVFISSQTQCTHSSGLGGCCTHSSTNSACSFYSDNTNVLAKSTTKSGSDCLKGTAKSERVLAKKT